MSFREELQKLSVQAAEKRSFIAYEEMAKQTLIIPFLQTLKYDVFNPQEVRPEYIADFGKKKGEKVDYAIFKDYIPVMFIECKSVNEDLSNHCAQLERYFNSSPDVRLAVLTNGIEYRFFTDLDKNNIMDENPFFKFNITALQDNDIEILARFTRDHFETEAVVKYAEELIYTSNLNTKLRELFKTPSEDFIRYLIKDLSDTKITAKIIERFRPIVKKSISLAIVDLVRQGILQQNDAEDIPAQPEKPVVDQNILTDIVQENENISKKQINTTEEELHCFEIIKSILTDAGRNIAEVNYKDTTAYFGIFNRNSLNWFIRLNLDSHIKYMITRFSIEKVESMITGFTVEQAKGHGESRVLINSIGDLVKLKELVVSCFDHIAEK
jgi:hypothetical protein